jgi:transposase
LFLKRCRRRKCGKDHVYWQLVESYRTPRGSRHRVVAYLGELSKGERRGWTRLAATLDGKAASKARQLSLFEPPCDADNEPVPETVQVRTKGVRIEGARDFGDVYLATCLWRMLGLDDFFERELPEGREEIPWHLTACALAVARFCEPSSELHVEDTWYRRTALADILGVSADKVERHRLYRTLDRALPLKPKIELALKERIGELFSPDFDILLYDVTSTYFEGERNRQAKRGYSRDHRGDCKQVCIGLVVTTDGFPLGYEVFDGNRNDVTTLEEVVEKMEAKYGRANRIWVFDRGIVSEANLEFLRERGGRYLVGTPKKRLRKFEKELIEEDWREVRHGVKVKLVPSPEGPEGRDPQRPGRRGEETFVLCRSGDRREKEKAMHERFVSRIRKGLVSIQEGLRRAKRPRDKGKIERRIGGLLGKNSRAAKAFEVELLEDPERPAGVRLRYRSVKKWRDWAALSEGCYLLRTNLSGETPEELWRMYIQLTDVEEVFRTEKTELAIRPIWHQLEKRVQAHVLFSFLAYAMWKTLQTWMERSGVGRGARTVIEEFAKIKAADVVLPTTAGRDVKLTCITRPDKAQAAIIERLGLELPERLGRPRWVPVPAEMDPECSLDFSRRRPQIGR